MSLRQFLLFGCLFLCFNLPSHPQSGVYHGKKISVPVIPPADQKIRLIIVSDATNEIDDVWAISLALLYPERFDILGFVGSNYDHTHLGLGAKSVELSVKEIHTILEKAGMNDRYPVYEGGHPMRYEFEPSTSEGIDFIVEKAMESTPEDPLWVVGLGSATDLASAYLQKPEIHDRVIMYWHARTENTWPKRAINYNIKGDMHAAKMMFHAPFPLVLFDTGTNLTAGPLEETEKYVKPHGMLGEYLYNYRLKNDYYLRLDKGYFDMGDISALIDSDIATWEVIECPTVNHYMDYNFEKTNGKILRCVNVDRNKNFELFYSGLARHGKSLGN
jgi:hypothetical protein